MKGITEVSNLTAGEIAPILRGNVELPQHKAGARQLFNAFPVITGGARSRPGTTLTGTAKNANKKVRLIPFVLDASTSYVIELGELYARFFKDGAAVGAGPYEITHPYTEAQLFDIDYTLDENVLYLAHQDVPVHRFRRFADEQWTSEAVPFVAVPSAEIGLRATISLTLSAATVGSGRTVTASGSVFLDSDVGRAITHEGGVLVITGFTSSTVVTGDITIDFQGTAIPADAWLMDASPQTTCTPSATGPVGQTITLTLALAGWRAGDVGSFVSINGGLCQISAFTSTTIVDAVVKTELNSATAAPSLAWILKSAQWNTADGYPRTINQHQQRLVAAGSPGFPTTVWGSRIGESLDYTVGVEDDAPYSFTLKGGQNSRILYLAVSRHLMVLTVGGVISLRGQTLNSVLSTSNPPEVVIESTQGATSVKPVNVDKEALYVQRSGKEVRGMNFRFDIDGYDVTDTTLLAEHLIDKLTDGTSLSVVEMAYQARPHSMVWVVRSDGILLSLTLDRTQGVLGWAKHDVGGIVESVCVVPGTDADVVYLSVQRTIDSVVGRYIERIEMTTSSVRTSEVNLMQLDMAETFYNASGQTSVTHSALVNTPVEVIIDGAYMGSVTTSVAGLLNLEREADSVQVGLPFTALIEPSTPEDSGIGLKAIGQKMSINSMTIRLHQSGPFKVNDQLIDLRNLGTNILDQPITMFTGDYKVTDLGWSDGQESTVVKRDLPFPINVLSIIRSITINQS